MTPEVWPGFAATEGSERSGEVIRIVDHDPEWLRRFQRWHRILRSDLGETARRIEHVGSTSVPGLAAKPIIDIQVSVADLDDESRYVPPLEHAGAQLRSRDHLHRYFRPFPGQPRDVHVHVCAAGSAWERDHLLFRDYLRTHPRARDDYVSAKRRVAATWADGGIAYTDAKSDIILTLLEDAKRWSNATETLTRHGASAEPSTRRSPRQPASVSRKSILPRDDHRRWRGGWRPAGALSRAARPA